MKSIKQILPPLLMAAFLLGCSGGPTVNTVTAETDEAIDTWMLARHYQAEGRYELAKQYYSLALSAVRTQSALDMLKRDMATVDMQLRALR